MVDGAEHLISCHWLAFLSAFSHLQLIQDLEPSTICWCQCDIRMSNEEWKMRIFFAFWEYLNFKIVDFGKSTPSDFFVHRIQDLDTIENLHKRINQKVKPNFFLTAISHRGLRNCFFFEVASTFSMFFLDFYFPFLFGLLFPFSLWTLLFPFSLWTFILFNSFKFILSSF